MPSQNQLCIGAVLCTETDSLVNAPGWATLGYTWSAAIQGAMATTYLLRQGAADTCLHEECSPPELEKTADG